MSINDITASYGTSISKLSSKISENKTATQDLGLAISNLETDNFISTTKTGSEDLDSIKSSTSASPVSTPEELSATIEKYQQQIEQLENEIKEYENKISNYEIQLRSEKLILADKQKLLTESQVELDELNEEYELKQDSYASIILAIENATSAAEAEAQRAQQKAIFEAMMNYNEEEDGDYNSYLQECLAGVMPNTSLNNLISNLQGQSTSLMSELGSLSINIDKAKTAVNINQNYLLVTQSNISELEDKISDTNLMKTTANLQVEDLNGKIGTAILSQISDAEKELVKSNNIDLTETFPDGSPKYIIAPGKSDNKLHIYEMDGPNSTSATTLARKYCPNGGFNVVESGNGYMRNLTCAGECSEGSSVYNLTCVSDDLTTCKFDSRSMDYCTSSPLSFDLNGDGVKTSDELVQFDIDGDGITDTINNSADAVLVFDADGDGISGESGLECFGDNTDLDGDGVADGYANGFDALKALAKKENLINGVDDNKLDENDIKLLEEKYGLKIKTEGYNSDAVSLFDAGITEINLSVSDDVDLQKDYDGNQNDLMTQEGATFVHNGELKEYADIWHSKKNV